MAELPGFFWTSLWIFIVSAAGLVVFIWLFVRGNKRYSVDDAESHAEDYANVVREGHGGMTAFLWAAFAVMLAWMIYYLIVNWHQFYVITAIGSTIE